MPCQFHLQLGRVYCCVIDSYDVVWTASYKEAPARAVSRAKGLVTHTVLLHELQRIGTAHVLDKQQTPHTVNTDGHTYMESPSHQLLLLNRDNIIHRCMATQWQLYMVSEFNHIKEKYAADCVLSYCGLMLYTNCWSSTEINLATKKANLSTRAYLEHADA